MAARRALLTGASGFVGSHIAEALVAAEWRLRALMRQESSSRWLESLEIERAIGDVTRAEGLTEACADCEVVVHAAGVTRAASPATYFRVNRDGTSRLVAAATAAGVRRFVLISSLAARGSSDRQGEERPAGAYGKSKREAEQILLDGAGPMAAVIVRAPAVYGPRDTDTLALVRMAKRGWFPMVHGGDQKLSVVHAADLAQGVALAAGCETARGHYTFTDGKPILLRDWGIALGRALSRQVRMVPIPHMVMWLAAASGESVERITGRAAGLDLDRLARFLGKDWTVSDARARTELNYAPRFDLDRGLTQTVAWYQKTGWI